MAERIGNIVYRFCCFVAAIWFAGGVSVWFLNFRERTEAYSLLAVSFIVAFLVWLIENSPLHFCRKIVSTGVMSGLLGARKCSSLRPLRNPID
jgi:hypothetical protein